MEDFSKFSNFFYPESIAIIGVSSEKNNLGKNIVQNCLTFGYQGEILPVGRSSGVAFGQKIYRSLEEIDRHIDLAVILTPAKTIPGILEQCGQRGIKWAVIESGGFSEMGEEGKPLEVACNKMAERYGIRFIGPNGIGITNLVNGLALPFMSIGEEFTLGPVSVLAQSGGVGLTYLGFLSKENIGINKFVSIGNKLNVNENDLLGYLIQDKETEIILLYLESFSDGRRFMEIASTSEKPILVHKSNRFKATTQVAYSHTAALFADDALVDHILDQVGCVRISTMDDAVDLIKSLTLPPLKGNSLAVVSRSGGHAVIAADACTQYGFHLPRFPDEILKKVESRLRAHVIRLQNPLDLGDLFELEFYEYIVEEILKMDNVDGALMFHGYRRGLEQPASRVLVGKIADLVNRYQKPVALVIFANAVEVDYLKKNFKIPIFTSPEKAMCSLYLSYQWASRRLPPLLKIQPLKGIDSKRAGEILKNAAGKDFLLLNEATELLRCYGFSLPPQGLARSKQEALETWRNFKGPVAMKINRPHISHKTDSGVVILDLDSEEQVVTAFHDLQAVGGEETEVLLQGMADKGLELILGGKQDEVFGPVILFGLGGIFVEAFEDIAWCAAPIDHKGAAQMIHSIKTEKILSGLRGESSFDKEAIADLLVRLSHMLVDLPVIQEIDINPVMVFHQSAQAIDARIILKA